MSKNKGKVFKEVYEILSQIDKAQVMKIPLEMLNKIKDKKDDSVVVNVDWNKPLNEQNLEEDTLNILAYFNYNYWADSFEKEELDEIYSRMKNNSIALLNEPKNVFKFVLDIIKNLFKGKK